MSEPLDLRALEARLKFGDSLDAAECGALVAALRAHRAALEWTIAYLPFGHLRDRVIAALASCTDHADAPAGLLGGSHDTAMHDASGRPRSSIFPPGVYCFRCGKVIVAGDDNFSRTVHGCQKTTADSPCYGTR